MTQLETWAGVGKGASVAVTTGGPARVPPCASQAPSGCDRILGSSAGATAVVRLAHRTTAPREGWMMVGHERLLDMTPPRREESDSTPPSTVSALYINVPISYIMSSKILRFHQMNQLPPDHPGSALAPLPGALGRKSLVCRVCGPSWPRPSVGSFDGPPRHVNQRRLEAMVLPATRKAYNAPGTTP